tara:strand:- start:1205 stop:1543 length:339 start_codon:yes stop_codon:yes gene_type:complete
MIYVFFYVCSRSDEQGLHDMLVDKVNELITRVKSEIIHEEQKSICLLTFDSFKKFCFGFDLFWSSCVYSRANHITLSPNSFYEVITNLPFKQEVKKYVHRWPVSTNLRVASG